MNRFNKGLILIAGVAAIAVPGFLHTRPSVSAPPPGGPNIKYVCSFTVKIGTYSHTPQPLILTNATSVTAMNACKNAALNNIVSNGYYWSAMQIPQNQQDAFCRNGATVTYSYKVETIADTNGDGNKSKLPSIVVPKPVSAVAAQNSKPTCTCPTGMVFSSATGKQ